MINDSTDPFSKVIADEARKCTLPFVHPQGLPCAGFVFVRQGDNVHLELVATDDAHDSLLEAAFVAMALIRKDIAIAESRNAAKAPL